MRTILYYAIAKNDSIALNLLIMLPLCGAFDRRIIAGLLTE